TVRVIVGLSPSPVQRLARIVLVVTYLGQTSHLNKSIREIVNHAGRQGYALALVRVSREARLIPRLENIVAGLGAIHCSGDWLSSHWFLLEIDENETEREGSCPLRPGSVAGFPARQESDGFCVLANPRQVIMESLP